MFELGVWPYILMVIGGTVILGVGLALSFRNYARWQSKRQEMVAGKTNPISPTEPAGDREGIRPTD
jgi:hypothetical protein